MSMVTSKSLGYNIVGHIRISADIVLQPDGTSIARYFILDRCIGEATIPGDTLNSKVSEYVWAQAPKILESVRW